MRSVLKKLDGVDIVKKKSKKFILSEYFLIVGNIKWF